MNVVKCSNNHFFDGDSYQVCPHCGAPAALAPTPSQGEIKEKKKGLFGRKNKGNNTGSQTPVTGAPVYGVPPMPTGTGNVSFPSGAFGDGSTPTVDMPIRRPEEPVEKKEVTLDFWQTTLSSKQNPSPAPVEEPGEVILPQNNGIVSDEIQIEKYPDMPVTTEKPVEPEKQTGSLLDKVRNASANSEGKTMSYFSAVNRDSQDSVKSEKHFSPTEPVVGWLVCIQGNHFGESFNIGAGMNSIGRSDTNRIVLDRDMSVSREKHALITYEPKHRKFYVKPGDSSGLTYVNDEYITETKGIVARDIIELGSSKFIFIPLCGEDFTWEDYMKG